MSTTDIRPSAVQRGSDFDRGAALCVNVIRRWALRVEAVAMQARLALARAI